MRVLTSCGLSRSVGAAALRRVLALVVGLLLASALAGTNRSTATTPTSGQAQAPASASASAEPAGTHGYLRAVAAVPGK
ncbi:hypothetical protein [Frankia sp. Cr2]|uniref:hypothetical protein n=1 Tax=Frankia sp. Cr2 TaxID=3073932 RepID=UPI002AD3936F|nr:hypothetical protein [Frankia sp. Cr2]